jgi:glycosyltransferase involved in cell wall biosynthesis
MPTPSKELPRIAVIIPCHNQSKYVEQALVSVAEQDYPNKTIYISDEASTDDSFNKKVVVDNSNFDNYLSEEEKILPQYENGQKYRFTGKVVAMQCSVGDSLKVQIHGAKKRDRELVAYPPEDKTTKDLDEFYEEDVIITALIKRDSLYHKPKLYIQDISLYQQPLI